jgi:hypothetical protein
LNKESKEVIMGNKSAFSYLRENLVDYKEYINEKFSISYNELKELIENL